MKLTWKKLGKLQWSLYLESGEQVGYIDNWYGDTNWRVWFGLDDEEFFNEISTEIVQVFNHSNRSVAISGGCGSKEDAMILMERKTLDALNLLWEDVKIECFDVLVTDSPDYRFFSVGLGEQLIISEGDD